MANHKKNCIPLSESSNAKLLLQLTGLMAAGNGFEQQLTEMACAIAAAVSDIVAGVELYVEGESYTSTKELPSGEGTLQLPLSYDGTSSMHLFFRKGAEPADLTVFHQLATLIAGYIARHRLEGMSYQMRERLKELKGIRYATTLFKSGKTIAEGLQELCGYLPEAWQYPEFTVVRIGYNGKVYTGKNFRETPWSQCQRFETPDKKAGTIEVFYLKEFPESFEGPFLKEERELLDNLAALITGAVSGNALHELLYQNTERLKELKAINEVSAILGQGKSLEESLEMICQILPQAWQYPSHTVARIIYNKRVFKSPGFNETAWVQKQFFTGPGNKKGVIEVYYIREFPPAQEGPFLQEERNLLVNLAALIAGSASRNVLDNLMYENRERLKELQGINQTSAIIAKGLSPEETLQGICDMLPRSWQYPKHAVARIQFEGRSYTSVRFRQTAWWQKEHFVTIDNKNGSIELFYLRGFPLADEGPFLKEERNLLINIARLVCGYINNLKGREIYALQLDRGEQASRPDDYRKSLIKETQPLQSFFNRQIMDKYIYLDMMKYKVREILFVATLYDAFMIENEDHFFEQFMGEIYQYSLFSLPRITGVTSAQEALNLLETTRFDLVILMAGIDRVAPVELSRHIKEVKLGLPIYLLLNQKANIHYFEEIIPASKTIDKLFVWNGDSQIFFAMVKSMEDMTNVANDTAVGLVRVILIIEDSAQYYSKYLPMLYSIVFGQVQQLLTEVEKNELDKISKMRSRPKIIHVRNYEDAIYMFHKYKDYMLCLISDVEFDREGQLSKTAGIEFVRYVKSYFKTLPVILQSSDVSNKEAALHLGAGFLDKNSESLLIDLRKFLTQYLAFGDFIFRDGDGRQLAVAKTLGEFASLLKTVPEESLYFHGIDNQFSLWLMGRGEIQLAKTLNPVKVTDFTDMSDFRRFLTGSIARYLDEKKRGKILAFDEAVEISERNIIALASGSIGGKGRGLAFINTLIYNLDFSNLASRINIRTPKTFIIGTDEFDIFLESNNLREILFDKMVTYQEIRNRFFYANLSPLLLNKLDMLLDQLKVPLAIRSSSISEDSITQPFAGVFETYILPNNHPDKLVRLEQLTDAIKLIYASVYSGSARTYFKAINHKLEDERMAVIIQELAGQQYDQFFYPHISGVACSYNYYPVSHMKPEEGFATAAMGLGSYVVEGGKSFRFSPRYPQIEMLAVKDLINSTQVNFLALDLHTEKVNLLSQGEKSFIVTLDIDEAEKHGTIKHCVSVYNRDNDRIEDGLSGYGPRIINFSNILKHNFVPLAETIDIMLQTIKDALGSPVEIEFAVDLDRAENGLPSFYLLQIKPLAETYVDQAVNIEKLSRSNILLFSGSSLGNGKINQLHDVIYADPSLFDKLKTLDMAAEIEQLNQLMTEEGRQYILIGPGRWGTREHTLGIPVIWSQISNARVIVEMSMEGFPLDASLGSHFFHNVTSMNVGYFAVQEASATDFIDWEMLQKQELVKKTAYFCHVRFSDPLTVFMDGKSRRAVILLNS